MAVKLNIPKKSGKNPVAITSVIHKNGKTGVETVMEETTENLAIVEIPDVHATVGVNLATTVNTGDFNNMKMGVHLSMPCAHVDVDTAFVVTAQWVEKKLEVLHKKYIE